MERLVITRKHRQQYYCDTSDGRILCTLFFERPHQAKVVIEAPAAIRIGRPDARKQPQDSQTPPNHSPKSDQEEGTSTRPTTCTEETQ